MAYTGDLATNCMKVDKRVSGYLDDSPPVPGWEVQVVADEVQGYDAESYPPNLEHAYVYYMENKLNRWRND